MKLKDEYLILFIILCLSKKWKKNVVKPLVSSLLSKSKYTTNWKIFRGLTILTVTFYEIITIRVNGFVVDKTGRRCRVYYYVFVSSDSRNRILCMYIRRRFADLLPRGECARTTAAGEWCQTLLPTRLMITNNGVIIDEINYE